jgi:hypothetical protein
MLLDNYYFRHDDNDDYHWSGLLQDREIHTYQIALNYCWAHSSSAVLLCPYGAGVNYINHNQTLANVKVQWAPSGVIGQDGSFLHKNLTALFEARKPRLAFDFVALRDIEEGEELFIDYGDNWEARWQEHVRSFEARRGLFDASYQSARQWNVEHRHSKLLTEVEQKKQPYPFNLSIRCHPWLKLETAWRSGVPDQLRDDFHWDEKDAGSKCHILERMKVGTEKDHYLYRVGIEEDFYTLQNGPHDYRHPYHFLGRSIDMNKIPRSAIQFFDAPYTSDLHIEGAFRHPIGIPDEIFPSKWKNLPTEKAN